MSKKKKSQVSVISDKDARSMKAIPHTMPIYASSTYIYESAEKARAVFKGEEEAFIYSRWSHPNAELVEQKIEQMETEGVNADCKALCVSTGMSAVAVMFQSLLKPGDVVLAQGNIYGTTVDYFNHYAEAWGIKVLYADFHQLDLLEKALKHNKKIKLLYAETPSNPTINCYDLKSLSALAHKYGAKMAVDNTFATPYLQKPFKFGVDFIVHSATKYLNGHGTALGGFLLGRDVDFIQSKAWKIRKLNGAICAPFDAWLLNNGMKTLELRMDKHCSNAQQIADFLSGHKKVAAVNYLGLQSHPDHALAAKQMSAFGGVLSFELKGGFKAGEKLLKRVSKCQLTASLGTTDTLIQHPAGMSHYFVPKKQRELFGITEGLIRLSVGIENPRLIIEDLDAAMS